MSVHYISAAIRASGLTPTEKLLLICIANYADEEGMCWPSNRRLSTDTGLSERAVRSNLKSMSETGLIRREERKRPDRSRTSDAIHLNFEMKRRETGGGAANAGGGGEPPAGGWGSKREGGGAGVAPLTSFEPSDEPSAELKNEDAGARGGDPVDPPKTVPAPIDKKGRPRTYRCPADWRPSENTLDLGRELGLPDELVTLELANLRDHEFRDLRSDWDATANTWLRNVKTREIKHARKVVQFPSRAQQAAADRQENLRNMVAGAELASLRRFDEFGELG